MSMLILLGHNVFNIKTSRKTYLHTYHTLSAEHTRIQLFRIPTLNAFQYMIMFLKEHCTLL